MSEGSGKLGLCRRSLAGVRSTGSHTGLCETLGAPSGASWVSSALSVASTASFWRMATAGGGPSMKNTAGTILFAGQCKHACRGSAVHV